MNLPTASNIATDLIARMLVGRAFSMACDSLADHAASIAPTDLLRLIHATCASYDNYQYNAADEVSYGRRSFVEELAATVRRSPNVSVFVVPETALAFAFHPTTRRAFIAIACQAPAHLDAIFADKTFAQLAANDSSTYRPIDALRSMTLRDAYWGRDADEHVAAFLAASLPPYIAGWHGAEYLQTRFFSLSLGTGGRPFIASAADAARRGLLKQRNVTMCGKFFERDPLAQEPPSVRDGLAVARALRLEHFLTLRVCPHFGQAGARSAPTGRIEHVCAAELLICTLEPLRLPAFVLLWVAQELLHVTGPMALMFVRNVERVYGAAQRLRERHGRRKHVEPAAPAVMIDA
jgi:hypothetical protein